MLTAATAPSCLNLRRGHTTTVRSELDVIGTLYITDRASSGEGLPFRIGSHNFMNTVLRKLLSAQRTLPA